jgi:predicted nucleic acid-binding protein
MKTPRIYADTSVFGGCFDDEFEADSRALMAAFQAGQFRLVVSSTVLEELANAPKQVRQVLVALPRAEMIDATPESGVLCNAYLAAGVVGSASKRDAEHIAIASVAAVDMIVSWNFKHIVHYEKIAGYHAVNLMHGYPCPRIYSPKEVAPQ